MPRKAEVGQDSVGDDFEDEVAEGADFIPIGEQKTGPEVTQVVEHDTFPEEYKEPLRGLLYLGELTDSFEFAGHQFVIRTLREGQLLKAATLVAQHEKTLGYQIAYRCAVVAASLVSVDGEEIYIPLGPNEDEDAKRFDKVLDWFPVTVDYVYKKYIELDSVANAVAEQLGEA